MESSTCPLPHASMAYGVFALRAPAVALLLLALGPPPAIADGEVSGWVEIEGRFFFHPPPSPGEAPAIQDKDSGSLACELEYRHQRRDGSGFVFTGFVRADSADPERDHADVRELSYLWLGKGWELRAGLAKVFWGATEMVHLVDVVNQTDTVESIDLEDKLGQPMVHLSMPRGSGVLDFFILPWFRERTFPGRRGRLRFGPVVDTDRARYQHDKRQRHVDFALRYSRTIGNWDLGVYQFRGTGREPTLLPEPGGDGEPVLVPFYQQIDQTGLDLQGAVGEWLFKLEALRRRGQGETFAAAVGGFEYTLVGLGGSAVDLGLLGEWAWDERAELAPTPLENDLMIGLRLGLNDAAGSQLLVGLLQDAGTSGRALSLEASRRLGSSWKASLEAWLFLDAVPGDVFYGLRDEDFLRLELAYHF